MHSANKLKINHNYSEEKKNAQTSQPFKMPQEREKVTKNDMNDTLRSSKDSQDTWCTEARSNER